MSLTISHPSNNEHIMALAAAFDRAKSPIRWLVITHNDVRLLNLLSSALTGESAAMLQVSQDSWDFHRKDLLETLEWALLQHEVQNLLLVGTSQVMGGSVRVDLADSQAGSSIDAGAGNLIRNVRRQIARTQQAQDLFSKHAQDLMHIPVVNRAWRDGELNVYGLLYREESGLLLQYDADFDGFRPLYSKRNLGA